MGRRIVIASFGSYGDVYPYIGLALGLKGRGHDPVLATSEFCRQAVGREGLGFVPVRPNIDLNDPELLRRSTDARHGRAQHGPAGHARTRSLMPR